MPLDAHQSRRFYDRVGRLQDTQRFYEDAALRRLVDRGDFARAASVFELGCGTGRFAAELLARELPADACYVGVDVSPNMVRLARARLAAWRPRVEVRLLEPPARSLPGADTSFDRFAAAYVFDLLTAEDARALIGEADRLLAPAGRLALVGLTHGVTPTSRAVSGTWRALALRWPRLLGGCRPIELRDLLDASRWRVLSCEVVTSWAVPSEVLLAARTQGR